MFDKDFLDYVDEIFPIEDVLYIIGKDKRWLLKQIYDELLEHKKDFFQGDEYYSEVYDD